MERMAIAVLAVSSVAKVKSAEVLLFSRLQCSLHPQMQTPVRIWGCELHVAVCHLLSVHDFVDGGKYELHST